MNENERDEQNAVTESTGAYCPSIQIATDQAERQALINYSVEREQGAGRKRMKPIK
jgi:hypothetical protein